MKHLLTLTVFLATITSCTKKWAVSDPTLTFRGNAWCVPVEIEGTGGVPEAAVGCTVTRDSCERGRRTALQYGRLGRIQKVGTCVYQTSTPWEWWPRVEEVTPAASVDAGAEGDTDTDDGASNQDAGTQ